MTSHPDLALRAAFDQCRAAYIAKDAQELRSSLARIGDLVGVPQARHFCEVLEESIDTYGVNTVDPRIDKLFEEFRQRL